MSVFKDDRTLLLVSQGSCELSFMLGAFGLDALACLSRGTKPSLPVPELFNKGLCATILMRTCCAPMFSSWGL